MDIVIPTTVLAEALYITEKHKVDLEFLEIIETINNSSNYTISPLDIEIIMGSHDLKSIPELHDRIIVATAILLDAKLITKDMTITNCQLPNPKGLGRALHRRPIVTCGCSGVYIPIEI